MAFFALLWKARTIEKYRLNYEKEKINSIVIGNTQMEQTLSQRWRHYRYDTQKRISRTFKKWYPEGSGVANFLLYLTTDQTFPNFLLKSLMGFVGGIILTYLCFMFFVFQLSISLIHATIMSSIIGVLLTLGLAFSYRIRCLVFLLIPQFFSRVGRYTLTCYALVLILTGPATNTLKNSEVLSESMACAQEQIKSDVHRLNDHMRKPCNSMKDSIKLMTERYQVIAKQVKLMIVRLNRLVMSIVGLIHNSFSWLESISKTCHAKLGSPYERCTKLLQNGIANCKRTKKSDGSMMCNMAHLGKAVCAIVKPFKTFCYVTDFMDEAIMASIRKKLKDFTAQIRALFHVKIHIHHSYSFSNITHAASQGAAGIVTEIRNRADPLLTWLSWSSCVTSLFLLLIIFRAKNYQHMYETRSHFDNRYVTKEFQELDLKRQRQGRETVLPLNRRERAKYITTTSFRLVASEKIYLTRSAVFMAVTTFKLLIHMVADYSLFWVLVTIRYHGKLQSNLIPGVPETGAFVTGNGFVARLFRSIVDTLNIPLSVPAPSLTPCLPDPFPPDFKRYSQIGVLIFLLWFFALFEPYGLRLRHLIMGQYRPERAKARATWLYHHILRTRAGFMKLARKKLHREHKYSTEYTLTFSYWLNDHIPFQWLKYMLGIVPKGPHCLLCGTINSSNVSDTEIIRCITPKCSGIYCTQCYYDIGQLCTICMSPADYGDHSDMSLEKGSSDDSDDDYEYYGSSNMNENTRLIEKQSENRTKGNKWNFFSRTQRHEAPDIIPLRQTTDYEQKKCPINYINKDNVKRKDNNHNQTFKYDSTTSNNIRLDYNNNLIPMILPIKEITAPETKSIGINTDKRCKMLNVGRFMKRFTMCRREKKLKKPRHELLKTQNNISYKLEYFSRRLQSYSILIKNNKSWQDSKQTVMRKTASESNIKETAFKEIKGIVEAVRLFIQKSSNINSTKNTADESKKVKDKPKQEDTPLSNTPEETNKQVNESDKSKEDKEKTKNMNKISSDKIFKANSFLTDRWKLFKLNIVSNTTDQLITDSITSKEKKNHKRRKKKFLKLKKDSKRTHSRILAFLTEQDWFRKRDVAIKEVDFSCLAIKSASYQAVPLITNKLVAMVQVSNTPFQWRESSLENLKNYSKYKINRLNHQLHSPHKHHHIKALDRLRNKINALIYSPPSSLVLRMMSNMTMASTNIGSSLVCSKHSMRNEAINGDSGITDTDILYQNKDYFIDFIPSNSVEKHDTNVQEKLDKMRSAFPVDSKLISHSTLQRVEALDESKSKFGRDSLQDLREKWIHIAEIPKKKSSFCAVTPMHSIKTRMKQLCSSIFGGPCNEKTCPKHIATKKCQNPCGNTNKKNSQKNNQQKKQASKKPSCFASQTASDQECCATNKASKGLKKISKKDKAKCAEIENAKIKEIERHIEIEKQLQKKLVEEQRRHKMKQMEIEKALNEEVLKHKKNETMLMQDHITQTKRDTASSAEDADDAEECEHKCRACLNYESGTSKAAKETASTAKETSSRDAQLWLCQSCCRKQKVLCNVETQYSEIKVKPDKIEKIEKPVQVINANDKCVHRLDKQEGPNYRNNNECGTQAFGLRKTDTATSAIRNVSDSPRENCFCSAKVLGNKPVCFRPAPVQIQTSSICSTLPENYSIKKLCQAISTSIMMPTLSPKAARTKDTSVVTNDLSDCYKDTVCLDGRKRLVKDSSALAQFFTDTPRIITAKYQGKKISMPVGPSHSIGIETICSPVNVAQVLPKTASINTMTSITIMTMPENKKKSIKKNTSSSFRGSFITDFFRKKPDSDAKLQKGARMKYEKEGKSGNGIKVTNSGTLHGLLKQRDDKIYKELKEELHEEELKVTKLENQMSSLTDKPVQISKDLKGKKKDNAEVQIPNLDDAPKFKINKETKDESKGKYIKKPLAPSKATHSAGCGLQNNYENGAVYARRRPIRKKLSLEAASSRELAISIGDQSSDNLTTDLLESEISQSTGTSLSDEDAKTDEDTSCIYSLATVNYNNIPKKRKCRLKLVTKANQATVTDKPNLRDTATLTSGWWSPVIDRKVEIGFDKKKTYNMVEKQRKEHRRSEINKDGRSVKFKSRTQIIPTGIIPFNSDVMSASRYLLESQKYYNELFAFNARPPFAKSVHYPPILIPDREKSRSPRGTRRNNHYHYRTKRLEECYTPRRQHSPKMRNSDSTKTSDTPRKRPIRYWRSPNRYPRSRRYNLD